MLLTGETAVISGAASPWGVGPAAARPLARRGTREANLAFVRAAFGHSARARLEVPGDQVA